MSNNTVTDDAIKNLTNLRTLNLVLNDTVTSAGYAHLPGLCVIDGKNTF
jgi:Leucine-rich repeat (LRR) protein